jgi:hypothetical protein
MRQRGASVGRGKCQQKHVTITKNNQSIVCVLRILTYSNQTAHDFKKSSCSDQGHL